MGCGALLVACCGCRRSRPDDHRFERGAFAACGIDEGDDIRNGCCLLEHTAHAAIASCRQLDGSAHRGSRQSSTSEDVLYLYADEDFGMRFSANAVTAHLVIRQILTHLAQRRDNIHASAAEERNEWNLHGAEASILATVIQAGVHCQFVT